MMVIRRGMGPIPAGRTGGWLPGPHQLFYAIATYMNWMRANVRGRSSAPRCAGKAVCVVFP
jgi:hypothetical protein